jgi:PIH1 N-terminal domain
LAKIRELLEKNKPVTSEDYLKNTDNLPIDAEGGLLIQPDPGFVFKTKELRTGVKVFINITSHPILEKPEAKEIVITENEDVSWVTNIESGRFENTNVGWQHQRRLRQK